MAPERGIMPPRSFVISLLCLPARINERGSVRGVAFLIALSAGVVHAEGDGGVVQHPRQIEDRAASLAMIKLVQHAEQVHALTLYETMNPPVGAERVGGAFVRRSRALRQREVTMLRVFFDGEEVFDKLPDHASDFDARYAFRFRTGSGLVTLIIDECVTLPVRTSSSGTEIGRKQFLTTPARPGLRKLLTTIYGERPVICGSD
jgi:hypothetical protein